MRFRPWGQATRDIVVELAGYLDNALPWISVFLRFFGNRGDRAKQTVHLVMGAGCEIERVGARIPAAAQGQFPQPIDDDWLAIGVPESTAKIPVRVERVYFPVTEISNENIAAEPAKGERCPRYSPRRIERPAAGEAPQQMAVGVEHVDKAIARACHVVTFVRLFLLCIGDEEIAVDVLDAERGETS